MIMISAKMLEKAVAERLDSFYRRRIDKLKELDLKSVLKRKNPYLFRAVGMNDAAEIVDGLLQAFVSSSDETLFGNEFFEPLAKAVAGNGFPGSEIQISHGEGADIGIETKTQNIAIAVKSGTSVFNAQSRSRQATDFLALRKRLDKTRKHFEAVVGYCYGRKKTRQDSASTFKEVAGQDFWEMLTGEKDFYLRILSLMKDLPARHKDLFNEEYAKAKNRFVAEFLTDFAAKDGSIDWEKLTAFNSGSEKMQ